ncbi:MAG: peptide ABC transporter substrate-binding protein [Chloroflexi bacterium]|nr:peptide ABC transporter substrate-binding protein [Chloroflexota bacterium]
MSPSQKKNISRLLPLTLFLLLLTACDIFGGANPTARQQVKAPPDKQTYTIPEVGVSDFDTLDPALAHDGTSISAIQMIFTGLVQLDDQLQVHPQLAQSWDQGTDGVTWTFHLRPNLKFSDGTPLTAADVAYSIDRALQPSTQSSVAPIYLDLVKDADQLLAGKVTTLIDDSLQTPNATTLIIVTRKKAAYFPAMLTNTCSYVVEKSLIAKYGKKFTDHLSEGGGAGPFKVAQYIHQTAITFIPDTNYYNAKPQLQKVTFAFYHSAGEAYQAYQNNKIDMTGVPASTFATDKKRKDFFQVPQLWINYYTMNYLVKPFDSIHIRQAFALAIDKTNIVHTIWKDTVLPTNHIVPQGMTGFNPDLTGPDGTQNLTGNPTKAQELLQQGLQDEGWTNVSQMPPITLTYTSGVPSFAQEVAALIQQWKSVLNITVTANPVDYNALLDKVAAATNNPNGLQFWGLAWIGEYPDPQDWLTFQFDKGVPNNNMNYGQNLSTTATQQQNTQQQLEAADANTQANARVQSYQQAEQQLVNDVAWIPMEQVAANFLRSPYIIGIVNNAQGQIPPNDWANIYRVQ